MCIAEPAQSLISTIPDRSKRVWCLPLVQDARYATTGQQYTYTYNSFGQKASETNLNGVTTQYTYGDQWGNLTQVVQDPGGLNRTTQMQYDIAGHVLQSTDPMGQISTFDYNNLGQPVSATFPATASTPVETVSYTYGGNGRTESVTDNRGTTSMAYEPGNDRVSSVTDPVTGTTSYTYGVMGERLTMTLPSGGTWHYTYLQSDGRTDGGYWWPSLNEGGAHYYRTEPKDDPESMAPMLTKITDDQGREVDIHQEITGAVREMVFNQVYNQSGSMTGYCKSVNQWDGNTLATHRWLKQLKTTWNWSGGYGQWYSRILSQNDYTYDNNGNRLTNTISSQPLNPDGTPQVDANNNPILNSRTEQYGYDELSRLTTVDYGDGGTQSYAFDNMGNRLQKQDSATGTENYTYNNANMLLTKGANTYTNDADGNTLTGGGRTNTWDSQNRLTTCVNGTNTSVFTYGADGLRHRSTVGVGQNALTTDYALDGQNMIQELRTVNGVQTPIATYLTGPSGPMYRRSDGDGTIRWYVYDGLGSVVGEVDPNGVMTARRGFDVYGATRSSSGTATSKHGFVGGLGHPTEDETGLVYMRARYYDPQVGRFVSEDSGADGHNWYVYAGANPVSNVDCDGKFMIPALLCAAVIGAAFGVGFYLGLCCGGQPATISGLLKAALIGALGAVAVFGIATMFGGAGGVLAAAGSFANLALSGTTLIAFATVCFVVGLPSGAASLGVAFVVDLLVGDQ